MGYEGQRLSDSARAVYDMGCKLHTLLLKNACTSEEDEGFKKVNLLSRWPAIAKEKGYRVDRAHSLVRALINGLVCALIPEHMECESNQKSVPLRNLVHISLQVHELILSPESISDL